jgi:hypothetical protein
LISSINAPFLPALRQAVSDFFLPVASLCAM